MFILNIVFEAALRPVVLPANCTFLRRFVLCFAVTAWSFSCNQPNRHSDKSRNPCAGEQARFERCKSFLGRCSLSISDRNGRKLPHSQGAAIEDAIVKNFLATIALAVNAGTVLEKIPGTGGSTLSESIAEIVIK
jgi:hypothetical protein